MEAAAELKKAGKDPEPEVMIPLTAIGAGEMEIAREAAAKVLAAVEGDRRRSAHHDRDDDRGAASGDDAGIAKSAELFSFGTNDLTQMGWGFSRDGRVEGAFFSRYIELGVFWRVPVRDDRHRGRGPDRSIAARKAGPHGRTWNSACGEHGGDPDSVHFLPPGSASA